MEQTNWGICGHTWAVELLRAHIAQGQPRHAYLFTGASGVGRRTLALRFAQALNCPSPSAPGEPCRICRTCQQIERAQHADLTLLALDKEGIEMRVEDLQPILRTITYTPYQSRYRIALIVRFEQANHHTANALLKTLEEAPPQAILLLTASYPEALLPTIVSRCEVMRLRPLEISAVQQFLQAQKGCAPELAQTYAHLSGGRVGYAVRLAEAPALYEAHRTRLDELLELLQSNRRARMHFTERYTKGSDLSAQREVLRQDVLSWLSWWRDVMLIASGSDAPLANIARIEQIRRTAEQVGLQGAAERVRQLEQALEYLSRYVNHRLLADITLLEMPYLA